MKNQNDSLLMPHVLIGVIIFALTVVATYFIVDFKTKQISEDVVAGVLSIEYDKVWWMENYKKINDISRKQIEEALSSYNDSDTNNGNQADPAQVEETGWSISMDQVEKVTKQDTYILWNPDAEISFVEYSDLECPFCKRLHDAGTIGQVLENYDWKVNFIFKQFPLSFHANAQMEAEAALCVWDLAGGDKYYEFIEEVFANSKANGTSYTEETISDLWAWLGVDRESLLSCIASGKFTQQAKDEMEEGRSLFGITGTPGNVLINNKTGDWDKLPWAYPYENFKEKIDVLLEK